MCHSVDFEGICSKPRGCQAPQSPPAKSLSGAIAGVGSSKDLACFRGEQNHVAMHSCQTCSNALKPFVSLQCALTYMETVTTPGSEGGQVETETSQMPKTVSKTFVDCKDLTTSADIVWTLGKATQPAIEPGRPRALGPTSCSLRVGRYGRLQEPQKRTALWAVGMSAWCFWHEVFWKKMEVRKPKELQELIDLNIKRE